MNNIQKPDKFKSFADLGKATGNTSKKKILEVKKVKNDSLSNSSSKSAPNIGWMFSKDYFKNVDFNYVLKPNKEIEASNAKKIEEKNKQIIEQTSLVHIFDKLGNPNQNLDFQVLYPGLVTGIGITHEAGVVGEFKLGLHFDYTYGSPVIHGSSVKGLLRSVFPNFKKGKDKNPESKLEFLIDTIGSELQNKEPKKAIKQIEDEIFEGLRSDGTRIDIYHRDIFFDAIIIEPDNKRRIVERDALAPHGPNPLKDPIPLPFLKISPGCTIQFRFDVKKGILLEASQKIKLFQAILCTLGIGAKTNVGYGQFDPVPQNQNT